MQMMLHITWPGDAAWVTEDKVADNSKAQTPVNAWRYIYTHPFGVTLCLGLGSPDGAQGRTQYWGSNPAYKACAPFNPRAISPALEMFMSFKNIFLRQTDIFFIKQRALKGLGSE